MFSLRVRLYMLTSDLTSLVPLQFSHWLQVRKVGTVIIIPQATENSGQFLLLRTDILQKTVVGAPDKMERTTKTS